MMHPPAVRRGFFDVDGRQVHYRVAGQGPPTLFIHSSPTNSSFVVPDMLAQADRHTGVAFDTPGFGLSDPLALDTMTVADLADATAAAMAAFGLPPLPVFGTHSGAAIALELGHRHPERVTGLVLDGVPIFTREEVEDFADERYFAPLVADPLGGHYAATWTRFRDQRIWFPWYARRPDALNENDLLGPESIHDWVRMFFAAAAHYRPAYRACVYYCADAIGAVRALRMPAVFTATTTDMLYPHLARLPPLREDQAIVEIGTDIAAKHALTGKSFDGFGDDGQPPVPTVTLPAGTGIRRQFVMLGDRAQMLRHVGARDRPVVLMLHDLPGSGLMIEPRMIERAQDRFVVAPDIPGSGESTPLAGSAELGDYARAMLAMCDALGITDFTIEASGFGASLGVEIAAVASGRCTALAIDGLLLPDPEQRAELQAHYAPPITIERDGAHWYRLWLRLRDELIYWPWYDTRRTALRRIEGGFDGWALHHRTVETMKQAGSYHHCIDAVLRHDAAARLAACRLPVTRIADLGSALGVAYGARLDQLLAGRAAAGSTDFETKEMT